MIYILGLLARSGHGKTTVASHLVTTCGAEVRSLAGPLKRAVRKVFDFSEAQVWGTQAQKEAIDPRYGVSPRWLLQRLGTEGLREEFGDDIHVTALVRGLRQEVQREEAAGGPPRPRLYVVDDVRFPNDARFIAEGGPDFVGAVLKLVSSDAPTPEHAGHASEAGIEAVSAAHIAATVVSSRAQGISHLLAQVDHVLRAAPACARLRPALMRQV